MYGIGNVRASEGEVLERTYKLAKFGDIDQRITISNGELLLCTNRGGARFAVTHGKFLQEINSVLQLSETQAG